MYTSNAASPAAPEGRTDRSIGRIVSVTGSKAIVLLDDNRRSKINTRPEMGTLLCIETTTSIALGLVSALSVPVPAQKEDDPEVWIAELGLVGEMPKDKEGRPGKFNRGVTFYPSLGDRVRVASREELITTFSGEGENAVRVGTLRQDSTIAANIKTDDMLGKHFAILGTTGTGKSCTTALILRAILDKNPHAHIVLLDPHNEYATSFGEQAEVITPHNLHLPYWLLTFEELIEVLIGDPEDRKHEIEILQELIPACKGKYSAKGGTPERGSLKRSNSYYAGRYTVDTPVPYRMSDLLQMLDDKMGLLENKKDLSPYKALKARLDQISQDQRYAFMFGGFTVNDSMAQILGRFFRVPVNNKPITILELTGLPTEIINVVVSVLCRMTFDFALWGEGHVPVTLVCEEAHRYVPANASTGFEPAKRAIAKIAKEGRKYGASLCIVTQRPAEIDPTILSQCNTVFALRMSNDRDQQIVQSAIADTGSGLLEFLPALGAREAIAFGDGMMLPVRIRFDELPKQFLPRSSTARFSEKWQESVGDEAFLATLVERWRASGAPNNVEEIVAPEPTEAELQAQLQQTTAELLSRGGLRASAPQTQRPAPEAPRSESAEPAPTTAPAAMPSAAAPAMPLPRPAAPLPEAPRPVAPPPQAQPRPTPQPTAQPEARSINTILRRTTPAAQPQPQPEQRPSLLRREGGVASLLRRRDS